MALGQLRLDTKENKIEYAIKLLKDYEPKEGYYLGFSGGKDSVVAHDIAVKAGVKFDAHYCVSPIDPPEIYSFIREHYPDVIWDYHAKGFWKLVEKKALPMRNQRWCCDIIKEAGGFGRIVITGVRRSESTTRKTYADIRTYIKSKSEKKIMVYPIANFTEYDIWQYIRDNNLSYCSLYDEGFKRLGCVLCPFCTDTKHEIERFPKIAKLWLRACEKLVQKEKNNGYMSKKGKPLKHKFKTGQEKFDWWVKGK